ncbi:pyridoxamine 5'-phosphate oxidase family protein [Paenibacillus sp. NPDC058174]|uniref:pyridoxamine 5'-phosphate oxidase family protein n=1 Tax=Paenibacillus sp. NPDC058174 TaxID=3346366 RepID=UPI0036D84FED
MEKVRYQVREVIDKARIEDFLKQARIGHLGMVDGQLPYVVPLNFVWTNEKIYFHGAAGGRRNQVMMANPEVCFTVCEEYGTITDPVPAKTDTAYMSVIIFGKAESIDCLDEATHVLQEMMNKYVPGYYKRPLPKQHVDKYRSSVFGGPVQVYRIDPEHITAKENPVEKEKMFNSNKSI